MVLSLGNQPELLDAVRSLSAQRPRPEIVVVNSGGGDAKAALLAAGEDVPVISVPRRLFAGGARNVGIRATSAPFVAFLAADCIAAPGWVAARARLHRAGAPVVAHVLSNAFPRSRSACAQHVLLHHRVVRETPDDERLFFGLSYARTLFDRFGLFREDLCTAEDTEFNGRLAAARVPMTYSPDVRTLHRYATRPVELLRDQFMRGLDAAAASRVAGRRISTVGLARIPLQNIAPALRQAARTRDRDERAQLLRSAPLIPPAAVAVVVGNLAERSLRRGRTGRRSEPVG